MKKVLLLDLGNVLVRFQNRADIFFKIIKSFGGDLKALDRLFAADHALGISGEDLFTKMDEGKTDFAFTRNWFAKEAGVDLSPERLAALASQHLQPIMPIVELVKRVQVPLVAVSNGNWASRHVVDRLGVYEELGFAKAFISCECHCKKPALFGPVIRWLAGLNIKPEESLLVDDIAKYCAAAENCGIPSICFDATRQEAGVLEAGLKNYGLL